MSLKVALSDGGHYFKGYIESLLNQLGYNVKFVQQDPDLLVFSGFGNEYEKYSGCKKIFIMTETWERNPKCDLRISGSIMPGTVYVPHYITSFHERKTMRRDALNQSKPTNVKSKFCAFMYWNDTVEFRNNFFDLLSKYKQVDGLGRCKKNTDMPEDRNDIWFYDTAVEKYRDYKFAICFENTSRPGYITEKIVNAMLAGAIPIYWGDPDIVKHFNPKSFINVHDFKSLDDVVERVKELDQNDEKYKTVLAEPWLAENNPNMSDEPVLAELRKLLRELNKIDVFYCINLKDSIDRRKTAESTAKLFGINLEFVEAIQGKDRLPEAKWYKKTAGELGCMLSHLKALDVFVKSGHQTAIIFEDDFELHEHFHVMLNKILKAWNRTKNGLILLSPLYIAIDAVPMGIKQIDKVDDILVYDMTPEIWSAAGYVVTKEFAQKCLSEFNNNPTGLSETEVTQKNGAIFVMPPLVIENGATSTIMQNREHGNQLRWAPFRAQHRYSGQMNRTEKVDIFYCINLKQSTDRKKSAEKTAQLHGINLTFVEAIDGKDEIHNHFRYTRTAGELGCMLSHLKALRTFVESKHETALILEDDFEMHEDFHQLLKKVFSVWDKDRNGLILLSPYISTTDLPAPVHKIDSITIFDITSNVWSAAGYVITRQFAQKCLSEFNDNPNGLSETEVIQRPGALFVLPPLVIENGSASNIIPGREKINTKYWNQFRAKARYTNQLMQIASMTLSELGEKYGTDKVWHGFTPIYDQHFKTIKKRAQKVLEVGVFFGSSIKMWHSYFENATIYGLDTFEGNQGNGTKFANADAYWNEVKANPNPRIKLFKVDQADDKQLEEFTASELDGTFDVIIDDGSHIMRDQQQTMAILFKLLRPGGYFIMEDLHCALKVNEYGVLPDFSNSTLNLLEEFQKSKKWLSPYCTQEQKQFLESEIRSVEIFVCPNGYSRTSVIRRKMISGEPTHKVDNKNNAVVLINYSNEVYAEHQLKNNRWAKEWGVDAVISLGPDDLDESFKQDHKNILDRKTGAGYWLWKPYIIKAVLRCVTNCKFIIYCDAGSNIRVSKQEWLSMTKDHELQVVEIAGHSEINWTKKEVLIALGANNKAIKESPQLAATIIGMTQGSKLIPDAVDRWLALACQSNLITDDNNSLFPEDVLFKEHRHDQSILSVILKSIGIKPFSSFFQIVGHHRVK